MIDSVCGIPEEDSLHFILKCNGGTLGAAFIC